MENDRKLDQIKASGYKAQKKWNSEHLVSITIRLNREADRDIIEYWKGIERKAELFRKMCREEMAK